MCVLSVQLGDLKLKLENQNEKIFQFRDILFALSLNWSF